MKIYEQQYTSLKKIFLINTPIISKCIVFLLKYLSFNSFIHSEDSESYISQYIVLW